MTSELAVQEQRFSPPQFVDALSPKERVGLATEIADVIKDVIKQRGWFKHIGESDHVMVEGWQFVASMAGATCKVVSSNPLADGNGWEAHAVVVRTENGIEIGAGDGMCSRAERSWAKRDDYALRAMASTRAMSRALRGCFSFIVELAGYRATPGEEMPDDKSSAIEAKFTETQHFDVNVSPVIDVTYVAELERLMNVLGFSNARTKKAVSWTTAQRTSNVNELALHEAATLEAYLKREIGKLPKAGPCEACGAVPGAAGTIEDHSWSNQGVPCPEDVTAAAEQARAFFAKQEPLPL